MKDILVWKRFNSWKNEKNIEINPSEETEYDVDDLIYELKLYQASIERDIKKLCKICPVTF